MNKKQEKRLVASWSQTSIPKATCCDEGENAGQEGMGGDMGEMDGGQLTGQDKRTLPFSTIRQQSTLYRSVSYIWK